jgi:sugar phosphate isomerase/epimerase
MKYAFMSSSAGDYTLEQLLEAAREYGYDGIEPRTDWGHAHGVEAETTEADREAIRLAVEASDVALACIATGCRYADPADREEQIRHTHRCIDLAADVGCDRLRVFGGRLGENVSRSQAIDLLIEAFDQLAPHAAERGVLLCLETHDAWTDPDHVVTVMQQVDRAPICVNWDVMHTQRVSGWSMEAAYEKLKPWIRHLHVHDGVSVDGKFELRHMGEGEFDHQRVIELLLADGYDGYLSGEWINWKAPEEHLPQELDVLKRYEELAQRA